MEAMVMIADDNNGQNTSELYGGVSGVMGSNREREVICGTKRVQDANLIEMKLFER
jgi:hypothetical protein